MKESQLGDLKKNIELQQIETYKAESKLKSSLEDIKKIKAGFDAERTAWETHKAALLKRTEEAKKQLKLVTHELAGLKQHIPHITATIFGKLKTGTTLFALSFLESAWRLIIYNL